LHRWPFALGSVVERSPHAGLRAIADWFGGLAAGAGFQLGPHAAGVPVVRLPHVDVAAGEDDLSAGPAAGAG